MLSQLKLQVYRTWQLAPEYNKGQRDLGREEEVTRLAQLDVKTPLLQYGQKWMPDCLRKVYEAFRRYLHRVSIWFQIKNILY